MTEIIAVLFAPVLVLLVALLCAELVYSVFSGVIDFVRRVL